MLHEQIAETITPATLAGAAILLLVVGQIWTRYRYNQKVKRMGGVHAPALANDPITSVYWLARIGYAQVTNQLYDLFSSVMKSHGTARSPNLLEINVTGNQRYFLSQDPDQIKALLTGKFAEYGKGPEFHRVWSPFLGDSIFTTDHRQWQDSRNMIRPMFVKNRVSDLHIFERRTQAMLNLFPKSGETFDLMDLFYRMTIDVITEFLLGESVKSLENPKTKFIKAFTDVQRWQILLTVLIPVEPIVPRWPYYKGIKVLEEFIVPYIDRALALPNHELDKLSKSDSEFTFLHSIANYTRDPKVIRDQIIAILLAGRDTTAATLSWTFYLLGKHPEVYEKLRAETLRIVGPDRAPTYEDLKAMKYLNNTLNETLRLYPAVPFNIRAAITDTTLPGEAGQPDISMVKGDIVVYSTMAMQRRQDLYPPPTADFKAATEFQPERWENWQPKAWTYVPFNGGPRICVGQNFALTEMAYVIARILQRYERMEYRGNWDEQFHKVEIVGTPGHGIPVAMYAAPGSEKA